VKTILTCILDSELSTYHIPWQIMHAADNIFVMMGKTIGVAACMTKNLQKGT